MVDRVTTAFQSGKTRPIEFREKQLKNLLRMYTENQSKMIEALAKDLRKSKQEAVILEVQLLINDVTNVLMNFKDWCKPNYVRRPY